MGDRSNILFRCGKKDGIGVYAHWSGLEMANAAMKVLKSKAFQERLDDPTYAMRIGVQIVLETLGASSKSETGFGLWTPATGPDDNEYRWIVIDVESGELFVSNEWGKTKPADLVAKPTLSEIRRRMVNEKKIAKRKKAQKKKRAA